MKLYATVTSERASKGQGGKHLTIDISGGNRLTVADMSIDTVDDKVIVTLDGYDPYLVSFEQFPTKTKGKKQKDLMAGWTDKDHDKFNKAQNK